MHEPENNLKDWWKNNKEDLDHFEKAYDHNDEINWRYCEGIFKSYEALEEFTVETAYHSGRKEEVVEIILSSEKSIGDIHMSGLEKVLEEINDTLEPNFTLEVYSWYTGVDKPGGKKQ